MPGRQGQLRAHAPTKPSLFISEAQTAVAAKEPGEITEKDGQGNLPPPKGKRQISRLTFLAGKDLHFSLVILETFFGSHI